MHVPFVDLHRQHRALQPALDRAVRAVTDDLAFISGPYAAAFERAFADFVGVPHVVGCANGTDALELALTAMGLGPGDEVIVPALTWISTAEAVSAVGARPVFADVEPRTYTLDPADATRKVTPATRALLPVHLYGQLADMPALMALADAHGLRVLEDAAQAHGAALQGRGAGRWGDAATFSFYPGKNLGAWGDAGAVATHDADLAHRVRLLANHGQEQKHHHQLEGRNSRLDGIQAAVLSAKLPHLAAWNEQRRGHATRYDSLLRDAVEVQTPAVRPRSTHVYHLYVAEVPARDRLRAYLDERGVATSVHYPTALPFQPCYRSRGHRPEDFPIAYAATQRIVSLPMFAELTALEVHHVAERIQQFFRDPYSRNA